MISLLKDFTAKEKEFSFVLPTIANGVLSSDPNFDALIQYENHLTINQYFETELQNVENIYFYTRLRSKALNDNLIEWDIVGYTPADGGIYQLYFGGPENNQWTLTYLWIDDSSAGHGIIIDSFSNYSSLPNASDYRFINNDVIKIEALDNDDLSRIRLYKNNILLTEKIISDEVELPSGKYTSNNTNLLVNFYTNDDESGFKWIRVGTRLNAKSEPIVTSFTGFGDDFGIF